MQLICEGAIILYDDEEDPAKDWSKLGRATMAFQVAGNKFRVIKDRQRHLTAGSLVDPETVTEMMNEYIMYSAQSAGLADLLVDGKGLTFLGASVEGEEG